MPWLDNLLLKIFPNYPEYKKRSEEKKELRRKNRFIRRYSNSDFAMCMYYNNVTCIELVKKLGVRSNAVINFAHGYGVYVTLKLVIWYLAETYKDFDVDDIQFYKTMYKEQPLIPDIEYNYLMGKIRKAYNNSLCSQTNNKIILYDMLVRFSKYNHKMMTLPEFDLVIKYLPKDNVNINIKNT